MLQAETVNNCQLPFKIFYCFLSKLFNAVISYRGITGITPTDLDDLIKFLKRMEVAFVIELFL